MATNTKSYQELLYPELSYKLTGVLFSVHNELGCYAREKQYGDLIAIKLDENSLSYQRECKIADSGNTLDFIVADQAGLELKAKRILTKEDYYQAQRYLQESKLRLCLLVNFRDKYIKPKRVIRIDDLKTRN